MPQTKSITAQSAKESCCRWHGNDKLGHILFSAVFLPSIRRESCSLTAKALTWSDNEKQSWQQRPELPSHSQLSPLLCRLCPQPLWLETLRARLRRQEQTRWGCDFLLPVKTQLTGWKTSCSGAFHLFSGSKSLLAGNTRSALWPGPVALWCLTAAQPWPSPPPDDQSNTLLGPLHHAGLNSLNKPWLSVIYS